MQKVKWELNEVEAKAMLGQPSRVCNQYMEDNMLSDSIKWGYGFYGVSDVFEENGKVYVEFNIGSSCD